MAGILQSWPGGGPYSLAKLKPKLRCARVRFVPLGCTPVQGETHAQGRPCSASVGNPLHALHLGRQMGVGMAIRRAGGQSRDTVTAVSKAKYNNKFFSQPASHLNVYAWMISLA